MKQLVLRGLRGGIGATSLLAGLGIALHEQGERVLLIDLSRTTYAAPAFSVSTLRMPPAGARAAGCCTMA